MKNILVVVSVVLVALVVFGAGFLFAQTNVANAAGAQAGYGPGNMMGGRGMAGGRGAQGQMQGQMQNYVEQALAEKLGSSEAEIESALASGKSMYQIAIDKGIKEADVTALLTEVHKNAFAKAVSDGVMTQAQADLMLQNMASNGYNFSGPMMQNGGAGRGMRGGGMMGGRNQQPNTAP